MKKIRVDKQTTLSNALDLAHKAVPDLKGLKFRILEDGNSEIIIIEDEI